MRSKSWQDILGVMNPKKIIPDFQTGEIGDFGPSIDEEIVFSNYKARGAAGNFIKRVSCKVLV
jgi:cholinesterase